jgi:c-di-GMP-binding flagellar brake protein YcgR
MMSETSLDSSASPHAERRRHPRCKVAVQLELHPHGMAAPFRTTTSDISPGGCYVETMFALEIGTTLKIKLWLDSVTLSTTGIVTTRHPQVGNGIQFTNIEDEDVRKLEQFLTDHAVAEESRPAS